MGALLMYIVDTYVCIWLQCLLVIFFYIEQTVHLLSTLTLKWNCMQFFVLFDSIKWKNGKTYGENARLLWWEKTQLYICCCYYYYHCSVVYFVFSIRFATLHSWMTKNKRIPPSLNTFRCLTLVIMIK